MQAFKHPSSAGLALVLSAALAGPVAAQTAPAAAPPALHPALKAAAAEPGAVVTASGLVFRQLEAGQGASPAATDVVRVHYRGTFPDGREFDSSYKRNQPASFALNRVIRCWTEGLQLMKAGATARLTCPADIAYGERGAGNGLIPPGAVLVFEVKLLGIGAN
jgi:FKBP-type peptidyl-prolyl cis-trans isomerase FkpA